MAVSESKHTDVSLSNRAQDRPGHILTPLALGRLVLLSLVLAFLTLSSLATGGPAPASAAVRPASSADLAAVTVPIAMYSSYAAKAPSADIRYEERVVAGGPEEFMMVRHVVLKGSNYAIGRRLGEIVLERGESGPVPSGDAQRNGSQREYMSKHYPVLFDRMRGLAKAFGLGIDDDAYDFSSLPQFHTFGPGCSAVFYPGAFTESGHSILSRNFDFTTGTIMGRRTEAGRLPAVARPYIFEIHPDRGYASIAICAFELLGGVLDGMNSEGLTVAIFADDETVSKYGMNPTRGVGLHELMSMRYLLDNCADVEEAKEAMLSLEHFYMFIPCQYIVGDRAGNSFVFEFSPERDATALTEGDGPQCITNHPVSRYESVEDFPADSQLSTYERYRALSQATEGRTKFSLGEIAAINASVAVPPEASGNDTYAPGRTLWHSLYDADTRTLRVKFYLGERPDPADSSRVVLEYSPYLEFTLEG
jgi:predicted choloylglycine hydrolase